MRGDYTAIDISDDPQTIDRLQREGWRQMPVVFADGESWSGYRPDKIRELKATNR